MSESFKQNVIFCRCLAGSCVRTSFLSRRIITDFVSSDCSSSRFTAPLYSNNQTCKVIMQYSRRLHCCYHSLINGRGSISINVAFPACTATSDTIC